MCRKFSAVQEHCHTKLLATRYSLFAIRYSPFNFHQSPITIRIFPDLPICRPHDLPTTLVLARQEPRPPIHSVPRPSPRVLRPVLTGGYENKACEAG
jgi:hypothetical protein